MVWIVGDKERGRSRQFKNAGWTIGCTRHGSINDNQRRSWRLRLHSEKPLLLYIVNFGGMGDTEDVSDFLLVMIKDQLNSSGLILLEAPESSSAWNMPHGKLTEGTDWNKVNTRWCGLTEPEVQTTKGERRVNANPKGETPKGEGESRGEVPTSVSKRSTYVRANFMLEDRRHCKCDISWEEHISMHNRHQVEHGNATFAAYVGKLLSERYVIGHACVPSSRSQRVGIEATSEVSCQDDRNRELTDKKKKKKHVKFVGEIPDGGPEVVAFPTDQRLRDKARKAETGEKKEVRKKKQVVEQVFDDCGEDFSGLKGGDDDAYAIFDDDEDNLDDYLVQPYAMLAPQLNEAQRISPEAVHLQSTFVGTDHFEFDDIAELGSSSTTSNSGLAVNMLIRRGFHGGPNFDVTCGYDLNTLHDQNMLMRYLHECKPYVLMISLSDDSDAMSRIAGFAAMGQLQTDRHFIAEIPRDTRSMNLPEWKAVFSHKARVKRISVDTCMWATGSSRAEQGND